MQDPAPASGQSPISIQAEGCVDSEQPYGEPGDTGR